MANNEDNFEEMYTSDSETPESYKRQKKEAARAAYAASKKYGTKFLSGSSTVTKRAILAALPYIGALAAFILGVIVLITIMVYIFSGPDMLRGQIVEMLDSIFPSIAKACVGTVMGDEYAAVTEQAMTDTAKYLINMDVDLIGSGFINSSEVQMYEAYKNGDENQTYIESDLIRDYLAAENRTYMLASVSLRSLFKGVTDVITGDKTLEEANFRSGMIDVSDEIDAVTSIVIDGKEYQWDTPADGLDNGKGGLGATLKRDITIDREARKMTIKIIQRRSDTGRTTQTTSVYNLEGWVGRFGKPIEFLLAMHLGTMAPKFAQTLATDSDFDARVNIRLFKTVETCKVKFKGMDMDEAEKYLNQRIDAIWDWMQSENARASAAAAMNPLAKPPVKYTQQDAVTQAQQEVGITRAQIQEARNYEKKNTIETYTPYIVNVTNHWYKDLTFKNLENASEDDAYVKSTNIAPRPSTWENGGTTFQVYTYSSGDIYQVAEPKESDINEEFDKLFTQEKWTIMDGSTQTAIKAIENAADRINQRTLNPNDLNMQIAITMLEKASQESDDAKYIVRVLKEYLELKGFKFIDSNILSPDGKVIGTTSGSSSSSSGGSEGTSGTSYSTNDIAKLKNIFGGKTGIVDSSSKKITIKTSEMNEGTKVYSVSGGTVESNDGNVMSVRMANGNLLVMSGMSTDTAIKPGTKISKGTPIATTTQRADMSIKVLNSSMAQVNVLDNL